MAEFLLRSAILVVLVGLVVWDIARERRGPLPGALGSRIRTRLRSGG